MNQFYFSFASDDTDEEDVELAPENKKGELFHHTVSTGLKEAVEHSVCRLKLTSTKYSEKAVCQMWKWKKALDI